MPAPANEEAERLQAELLRQQQLLEEIQRGEMPVDEAQDEAELLAISEQTDPRVAPAAPEDRNLPAAIFERSRVRLKAGAFGNETEIDCELRVLDADGDGNPELKRFIDRQSKYVIRQEADTNFDGVIDAWTNYQYGEPVYHVRDSNDDGNPDLWDRYAGGRATSREVDRDDDGVRDAFFRYENGSLVEEKHDADNDGRIDLHITLVNRRRVHAEEDSDHDGRFDTWIEYAPQGDGEIVTKIERDRSGRGYADTFETFVAIDGKATISQRDEDVDGDKQIDIRSIYRRGKLIRREIHNPDVVESL